MTEKNISELISRSVINLDKPFGITSRQVVVEIKHIFNCKKVGHIGTLDPRVTGVLVVALDKATKAIPVLMGLEKEYEGVMYLHKDIDKKTLEKTISDYFLGEITQTPPVKSHVARKPRKRIVYSFHIIEKDGQSVKFKTKVQAGTYIRKLCSDIGKKIGVKAQMKELRRTKVGHFSIENSHSLDEIKRVYEESDGRFLKKILIPIEKAIPHVKKIYVEDSSIKYIKNGAPVLSSDIIKFQSNIKANEMIAIFSLKNELIALGTAKFDSKKFSTKKKKSVVMIEKVL
jgi:H/ACA ribonucleoprotein complex subunit 4